MAQAQFHRENSSEFNLLHAGLGLVVLFVVAFFMGGCSESPTPQATNAYRPTYAVPVSNTSQANQQQYAPGPNVAALRNELSNLEANIRSLQQTISQHRSQIAGIDRELDRPLSDTTTGVDMWYKNNLAAQKRELQYMINNCESEIRSMQQRMRDISFMLARS